MTKNIYIDRELSAELEALVVKAIVFSGLQCFGENLSIQQVAKLKENMDTTKGLPMVPAITIFDLLYPENAEMVWGKEDYEAYSMELIIAWQDDMDWQAFIKRSLERRKLEMKVVDGAENAI